MELLPVSEERGAYFYFDVIRFSAASLVVIEHLRDLVWLTWGEMDSHSSFLKLAYFISGFGSAAVTVFFVLSGYWICASVWGRIGRQSFWTEYLTARLSRLWLVIAPALILGAICDFIGRFLLHSKFHLGTSGALTERVDVATRLTTRTFVGNLAFLQTLVVPVFGSNGSLWSLSNEFWYYIWFAAIAYSLRSRRLTLPLLTLGVGFLNPAFFSGFVTWLIGAFVFLIERYRPTPIRWPKWTLWTSLAIFSLIVSLARLQRLPFDRYGYLTALTFGLFTVTLLRTDPQRAGWLIWAASYGRKASFSLYAVHMPLLVLGAAIMIPAGRIAPDRPGTLGLIGAYLITLAIAFLFAAFTETYTSAVKKNVTAWLTNR